jgi:hypothetical protein
LAAVALSDPQTVAVLGVLVALAGLVAGLFSQFAALVSRWFFLRERRDALLKVALIRKEGVALRNEAMGADDPVVV